MTNSHRLARRIALLSVCSLAVAAFAVAMTLAMAVPSAYAQTASGPNGGEPIEFGPQDWPWWRGPARDGVAKSEPAPPREFSNSKNVVWTADIPGRGHGSACVVGDRVFVVAAEGEAESQSVICLDRATGKRRWQTEVHRGGFEKKGNAKTTLACCTPACDGRRVYVNFLNGGAVHATALDLEGKQLWQTKVTDFVIHQGFGASPAIYGPLVLIAADNKGTGAIAALERTTGKIVWKVERPSVPNYTSPIILNVAGREQLLMTGCDLVTGLDPLTGKKLWETAGATTECVTSTVTDGQLIFTSGGYPKNHLSAVRADGTATIAWENNARVYVPSMLVRDGYLYAVLDAGVAMCWKCDTGKEMWKGRLGGTFSSSPVLVGDVIYAANEAGRFYLFKAKPEAFELIGENQLGDEAFATPTICGGRIYQRVAAQVNGKRQELLYCLGNQP